MVTKAIWVNEINLGRRAWESNLDWQKSVKGSVRECKDEGSCLDVAMTTTLVQICAQSTTRGALSTEQHGV